MPRNDDTTGLIADIKEQVLYLRELGVEAMEVDLKALELLPVDVPAANIRPVPQRPDAIPVPEIPVQEPKPFRSRLGALPSLADTIWLPIFCPATFFFNSSPQSQRCFLLPRKL